MGNNRREAPRNWRMKDQRLRGQINRDCCRAPEPRDINVFLPCPYCGSVTTWTDEGYPVTRLKGIALEIRGIVRKEPIEEEANIRVDLSISDSVE